MSYLCRSLGEQSFEASWCYNTTFCKSLYTVMFWFCTPTQQGDMNLSSVVITYSWKLPIMPQVSWVGFSGWHCLVSLALDILHQRIVCSQMADMDFIWVEEGRHLASVHFWLNIIEQICLWNEQLFLVL